MTGLAAILLSVTMIAAFLLAGGGVWLAVTGRDRRKGVLMLVAAAVLVGNVLVWTLERLRLRSRDRPRTRPERGRRPARRRP